MFWFIAIGIFVVWSLGAAFFGKKNADFWYALDEKSNHNDNELCECKAWYLLGWPLWFVVWPCTIVYSMADGSFAEKRHQKKLRELERDREIIELVNENAALLKKYTEPVEATEPPVDPQLVIKPPRSS